MIKAHRITPENQGAIRPLYERFRDKSCAEYRWEQPPIGFDQFAQALRHNLIEGYWVSDSSRGVTPEETACGLMLYRQEEHRALEINVIYSELTEHKTLLDRLMRLFIEDIREREGWDVVSYAMQGAQDVFIRTITWYGFKPVGQAILRFDFMDTIAIQILQQQAHALPGPEYRLDCWQPEYAGAVAECVYAAFKNATDAKWDPRFRTEIGARKVVGFTTGGLMGTHLPSCTSVVLKNDHPVGFCFLLQADPTTGNIPLIGVHPDEKGKGLGNILLKATLTQAIQEMVAAKIAMLSITTTMDTDNVPAIKMYRRMGFREEYNYPHVYLTREQARSFQPGKWC